MAGLLTYPGSIAPSQSAKDQWQVAKNLLLNDDSYRQKAGITAAGTVEESHLIPFFALHSRVAEQPFR